MPAIKVRCAPGRVGEYRGLHYSDKSAPFYLVDRKDTLGNIKLDSNGIPITAEQAFADFEKNRRFGWMVRLEATPKELSEAQRRSDLEEQPGLAFTDRWNAGNSGEAAGALDIGSISANSGAQISGGERPFVAATKEQTYVQVGNAPRQEGQNLEVL